MLGSSVNNQYFHDIADLSFAAPKADATISDGLRKQHDAAANYCIAHSGKSVVFNEGVVDREVRSSLIQADDLWLPSHGAIVRVPISSIRMITADRDYVRLYSSEVSFLLRATMSALEKRLDTSRFVRIHRSTIIAIEQVAAVRHVGNGAWMATDRQGANHAIGRHFLRSVRLRLGLRPVENDQ